MDIEDRSETLSKVDFILSQIEIYSYSNIFFQKFLEECENLQENEEKAGQLQLQPQKISVQMFSLCAVLKNYIYEDKEEDLEKILSNYIEKCQELRLKELELLENSDITKFEQREDIIEEISKIKENIYYVIEKNLKSSNSDNGE